LIRPFSGRPLGLGFQTVAAGGPQALAETAVDLAGLLDAVDGQGAESGLVSPGPQPGSDGLEARTVAVVSHSRFLWCGGGDSLWNVILN
jgi:hypothetical protein